MARRRNRRTTNLRLLLKFAGLIGGLTGLKYGLTQLGQVIGWVVLPLAFAALIGGAALAGEWRRRKNLQAAAELARWESTAGWEPVPLDSPWPWLELVRWVDSVTVLRAYRKKEVAVGELEWRENAFGEAVDRWAGQAVFAILTLQQPAPPMAVREFRPQRQGDFWERFRVLGAESISPELLAAHLNDEIPPWTLTGEKLFFVVPLDGPLRAEDLEQAAATLQRLSSALAIEG